MFKDISWLIFTIHYHDNVSGKQNDRMVFRMSPYFSKILSLFFFFLTLKQVYLRKLFKNVMLKIKFSLKKVASSVLER